MGLALLSTIATSLTTSVLASTPHAGLPHALVAGFTRGFGVAAGFALAAAIVTMLTISRDVGRAEPFADVEYLDLSVEAKSA